MNSISVIENKISAVKKYLGILSKFKKHKFHEILEDPFLKGSLERYLYLATQSTIDLAEATIAFKDFRKPTTYSEAFEILNEEEIISPDLAQELIPMVGFRNAMAHAYEKLDYSKVEDVLKNKLKHIEDFIKIIAKVK